MSDRVLFREGVALQPQSLAHGLAVIGAGLDAADLVPFSNGTITLTGIGASLYAAIAGAAQLRAQGRRAFSLASTDLYDPLIDAGDSYIAISASGRSVEPVKAMTVRPSAPRIGIAKSKDSSLGHAVDLLLETGSGPDSGPNTTSYIGALQTLGLLAERIAPRRSGFDWTSLPGLLESAIPAATNGAERAIDLLRGKAILDTVGSGAAFGTAGYAALLIREAVRAASQHWDTLNFLHGPMEPNDRASGVILFGDGREVKLAQDLAGFGIAAVLVTSTSVAEAENLVTITLPKPANGLAEAILQSLPAQLITAGLAEAVGLPVCNFRYRQTDTKLVS